MYPIPSRRSNLRRVLGSSTIQLGNDVSESSQTSCQTPTWGSTKLILLKVVHFSGWRSRETQMARILKETEAEELVFNQDGSWSLPNGKLAITERALRTRRSVCDSHYHFFCSFVSWKFRFFPKKSFRKKSKKNIAHFEYFRKMLHFGKIPKKIG